jgi:hypothetical protein
MRGATLGWAGGSRRAAPRSAAAAAAPVADDVQSADAPGPAQLDHVLGGGKGGRGHKKNRGCGAAACDAWLHHGRGDNLPCGPADTPPVWGMAGTRATVRASRPAPPQPGGSAPAWAGARPIDVGRDGRRRPPARPPTCPTALVAPFWTTTSPGCSRANRSSMQSADGGLRGRAAFGGSQQGPGR